MESGSSFKSVVAEEGAHLDCSSILPELNPVGLLLQNKVRDGEGELESYEPIVITPLAVEGVNGQRVSPRWVVERIKRFYPIIGLSCGRFKDRLLGFCLRRLKRPETSLWQNLRLSIRLHKG